MNRSGWLEWRREGLGGTDVSAIMGLHPQRSAWDVYLSKTRGIEGEDSPEMRMGRDLEEPIGQWAAGELGMLLRKPKLLADPEGPLRGTPDFDLVADDQEAGLECKTARYPDEAHGWGPAWGDQVPEHYAIQCQTYMLLSGRPKWVLAAWFLAAYDRRIYILEADRELQDRIRDTAATWWHRHIVGQTPPPPEYSTACREGLRLQHPTATGTLRVATEAEESAARVLAEIEARVSDLTTERDKLRNYLRAQIGDDEGLRFTGGRVKWSRRSNRLTVRIR